MVYGIVKQSGGYIWVYSEPGHGTTVKIYLPRAAEPIVSRAPQPAIPPMPRGTETILLVEDEEQVRGLAGTILRQCGYHVLEATRGDEGLTRGQQHPGPIHLLLTDVVMPGLNGRELARRLGPTRPDMRVLFISGYTDDVVVHHGVLEEGIAFLQKPFTADALARRVREAIDLTDRSAASSQSPGAGLASAPAPPSAADREARQDYRPTGACPATPQSP